MDITRAAKFMEGRGYPRFRLKQLIDAVYKKGVSSWSEASVLPAPLRAELERGLRILSFDPAEVLVSKRGDAVKAALTLKDGLRIETVLLNLFAGKWSACVSTQAGCPVMCAFCATGRKGLKRNLSPEEISDQCLFWTQYLAREKSGEKLTGVVYMGMGEPFLNYDSTAESLKTLMDPDMFGLGARHISVSTVGHIPGIKRFSKDFPQVNLAVSLHAAHDELRSTLVPLNDKFPLRKLSRAIKEYLETTHRKVFIEYVLIAGVNDSRKDAERLAEWIHETAETKYFNVNIIPYNHTGGRFDTPNKEKVSLFANELLAKRVEATVRKSLGADIMGACGQLAGNK